MFNGKQKDEKLDCKLRGRRRMRNNLIAIVIVKSRSFLLIIIMPNLMLKQTPLSASYVVLSEKGNTSHSRGLLLRAKTRVKVNFARLRPARKALNYYCAGAR